MEQNKVLFQSSFDISKDLLKAASTASIYDPLKEINNDLYIFEVQDIESISLPNTAFF